MQQHPIYADRYPYTFALYTMQRNFYINAESEEKQRKWYDVIYAAIANTKLSADHVCLFSVVLSVSNLLLTIHIHFTTRA